MRKIAKAIGVAFSMYSKIPMPHFVWQSEDMQLPSALFSLDRCCDRGTGDRLVSSAGYLGVGKILSVALAVFCRSL